MAVEIGTSRLSPGFAEACEDRCCSLKPGAGLWEVFRQSAGTSPLLVVDLSTHGRRFCTLLNSEGPLVSNESVPTPQGDEEEIRVLTVVLNNLRHVSADARERILQTAGTYFGLKLGTASSPTASNRALSGPGTSYSEDRAISPKEFVLQKQPRSDVDKVACLAFYLTHYRDTPHFKTLEISKLNTEAAQVPSSRILLWLWITPLKKACLFQQRRVRNN